MVTSTSFFTGAPFHSELEPVPVSAGAMVSSTGLKGSSIIFLRSVHDERVGRRRGGPPRDFSKPPAPNAKVLEPLEAQVLRTRFTPVANATTQKLLEAAQARQFR